jgi:glycosyltransferase involved in cell wall biosynthesis
VGDSTPRPGPPDPRRVALLLESDGPGGAEVVVLNLAVELRARGCEVVPVVPAHGVGWLGQRYREAGFAPIPLHESAPPDFRFLARLARLVRAQRIGVVHSHEFSMCVYGALACALTGVRHVTTMHGNQTMTAAWRRRAALRWAFRRADAVVAVSEATKRQLDHDLALSRERIRVIRNGVPVRQGKPDGIRRELALRPDELLVAAVGNLDPRKAHIDLLRALAQLEREGLAAKWRLVIAGGRGGPEQAALETYAREHGLSGRVHIWVGRSDVADLLSAAHVFVMPSLWEGLPLALLEALVAGTATIASEVSGIPEAVRDGEEGLLVPPANPPALAAALRRLLEDRSLREKLAANGARKARAEFTIGAMTDAYLRLYSGAAPSEAPSQSAIAARN